MHEDLISQGFIISQGVSSIDSARNVTGQREYLKEQAGNRVGDFINPASPSFPDRRISIIQTSPGFDNGGQNYCHGFAGRLRQAQTEARM